MSLETVPCHCGCGRTASVFPVTEMTRVIDGWLADPDPHPTLSAQVYVARRVAWTLEHQPDTESHAKAPGIALMVAASYLTSMLTGTPHVTIDPSGAVAGLDPNVASLLNIIGFAGRLLTAEGEAPDGC